MSGSAGNPIGRRAFLGAAAGAPCRFEQTEGLIESIVTGNLLNEAGFGAEAAFTGILGRTAVLKGKEVTWEKLLRSKEVFDPKMDLNQFA